MIDKVSKDLCCGCETCVKVCPVDCIAMVEDEEGFLFPKIDTVKCIKCNRCQAVCPVIVRTHNKTPVAVYGYRTKDKELLRRTSSGGFFTAAAEKVLAAGGVVFGAAFNEKNEVVHSYVESSDKLDSLRRSKYVQSKVGDAFEKCKDYLARGRKVLFSGTPCQIKALRLFLGKDYENLITVDFVCHGVPSPGVFRHYLSELAGKKKCEISELHDINFRDKGLGYAHLFSFSFSFDSSVYRENLTDNVFLKGFLADLYLRRSCHNCKAKGFSSGADYTMCDFWSVATYMPTLADKSIPGVSEVFVVNDKLRIFIRKDGDNICKLDVCQKGIIPKWAVQSVPLRARRARFYKSYFSGCSISDSVLEACKTSCGARAIALCRRSASLFMRKIGIR